MPPNNKLWRFFLILTKNSDYYNHNNSILLVDDEKDILNLFVLAYRSLAMKNLIDQCFYEKWYMSNDISDSLRIDKIIEKPIHLENLIEEVHKLIIE